MLKINLLVAVRHFQKQKYSSLINVVGLTAAITTCLFLILYVFDELQYDNFNRNNEHIVRLVEQDKKTVEKDVIFPAVYFQQMVSSIPEIEKGFRINRTPDQLIAYQNKKFYDDLYFADTEMLDVMTFPLLIGNSETALKDPFSVILTEDMAQKYFGNEDPIGKVLRIENKYDLKVTGILKNIPTHSHIKPEIIASVSTLKTTMPFVMERKEVSSFLFYFLLKKNTSIKQTENKLQSSFEKIAGKEAAQKIKLGLDPLSRIYLYSSNAKWDFAEHGDIDTVKSFILVAILIMIMACFNYTNLFTTLVKLREKELAIRKLLGAGRKNIFRQILFETFLFCFVSFSAALLLVGLLINDFNQLTGKQLTFASLLQWQIVLLMISLFVLTVLLSIGYPSFIIMKSDSLQRLKGSIYGSDIRLSKITFGFRQIVTGFQFAITTVLIVAAIVIYSQMSYVMDAKLGFNKEQLLIVENPYGQEMYSSYEILKNKLNQLPEIISVSASENVPGRNINNYSYARQSGKPQNENVQVAQIAIDYGLFKTWQTKFLEGRDFSNEISTDVSKAVVINEAAVKTLGLNNPVGSLISNLNNADDNQQVIGVVENTHFKSFKEEVLPIVYYLRTWSSSNVVIRISTKNIAETIKVIERNWNSLMPDRPMYYYFVDDVFNKLYESEMRTSKMIEILCALAISIALIGLLSLVNLISQMRRKEIGVRKVLGASVLNIVSLITREYLILITTANLIAFPVSYYFLYKWLERFVYRIEISVWAFLLAGTISFVIGVTAVCYKIVKAATANPVESLRYE